MGPGMLGVGPSRDSVVGGSAKGGTDDGDCGILKEEEEHKDIPH